MKTKNSFTRKTLRSKQYYETSLILFMVFGYHENDNLFYKEAVITKLSKL